MFTPGNRDSRQTRFRAKRDRRLTILICCLILGAATLLAACTQRTPVASGREPVRVTLEVDGQRHNLSTSATTVRELLQEAGVDLVESDEVTPPLFTPLEDGLAITVVRVTESIEAIPRTIPFERKIVRNESMDADAPPIIIQGGKDGLLEETVRIVYRDGLEAERWVTQVTVVEEAQDEIVMIGIGAGRGNVTFVGTLAYVSDGTAVILRGLTAFPEQLNTGGLLDGRVFRLSPTGNYLLFTRAETDEEGTSGSFRNSLWVIGARRGAEPRPLGVENVLWADWNPARTNPPQIAFTTANPTDLPPGWEANNDLWAGDLVVDEGADFTPEQLVEAYPATYGWWGGNYAWSPDGRYVAYGYANEVGVITLAQGFRNQRHIQLQQFTDYQTNADWVWVPTLSWSPDGRYLAFTNHGSDDPETPLFDSWAVDVETGVAARFVGQSGMWAHLHWSPAISNTAPSSLPDGQIAFLKATDPMESQRSSYTLWLMDRDGSNARQVYPAPGENSFFPRSQQFMAWGPDGRSIAFVFNDALHMLDLETGEARRITQDDAVTSLPAWAPYGRGLLVDVNAPAEAIGTPEPAPRIPSHELPVD